MGTSGVFLSTLFLCGALGLPTSPPRAQGWLRCYACSFAKPCYPVPTECQAEEVCGITVGTSDQNEIIERKGCLPRAQCPLQGHAIYWLRAYALRHTCCEQDLCNAAALPGPPSRLLLTTPLLLAASLSRAENLLC